MTNEEQVKVIMRELGYTHHLSCEACSTRCHDEVYTDHDHWNCKSPAEADAMTQDLYVLAGL